MILVDDRILGYSTGEFDACEDGRLEEWLVWGKFGIELGEIERLIQSLNMLRQAPGQHFHISSDYKGNGGVGDIEIYQCRE